MLNEDELFKLAIEVAKKCVSTPSAFNVGAVLVSKEGLILSTGFSRELEGNTHAEEVCLMKLENRSTSEGATIYTTMEPCGLRLSGKKCCADLIIQALISTVVQGMKEPDHFVGDSKGAISLEAHGIKVVRVVGKENELLLLNSHFDNPGLL